MSAMFELTRFATPGLYALFRHTKTKKEVSIAIIGLDGPSFIINYDGRLEIISNLRDYTRCLTFKRMEWRL